MSKFQVFYLHRSSQCPLKSRCVRARLIKDERCVENCSCQAETGAKDVISSWYIPFHSEERLRNVST